MKIEHTHLWNRRWSFRKSRQVAGTEHLRPFLRRLGLEVLEERTVLSVGGAAVDQELDVEDLSLPAVGGDVDGLRTLCGDGQQQDHCDGAGKQVWDCFWNPSPDYFLEDEQALAVYWDVTGAPADAWVTKVTCSTLVYKEDSGDEGFWCSDYVMALSSATHGEDWGYCRVWDREGGQTDQGDDNDSQDDYDIDLWRETSSFNGESVNQRWWFHIEDCVAGDDGNVSHVRLQIHYQVPRPDLVPYQGPGWDSPIVISNQPGTTTTAETIYDDERIYVDFGCLNAGSRPAGQFRYGIWVHGTLRRYVAVNSLNAGAANHQLDVGIGTLSPGTHTFRVSCDYLETVTELDETNNEWERSFTITRRPEPGPNLRPFHPDYFPGWESWIVISNRPGTSTTDEPIFDDEPIYVDFGCVNLGGNEARDFRYGLFIDGLLEQSVYVNRLDFGETSYVLDQPVGTLPGGTHTFEVRCDYEDRVSESDEGDNDWDLSYQVFFRHLDHGPDLEPYRIPGSDDKIVISNVNGTTTTAGAIYDHQTVYVDFGCINSGDRGVYGNYHYGLFIDGSLACAIAEYRLLQGQYDYRLDREVGPLSAGTHTFEVRCDYEHEVVESDESNNVYSRTYTIRPRVEGPDLEPCWGSGWDDMIVISNVRGTTTTAETIYDIEQAYMDFGCLNSGNDEASRVSYCLRIDGRWEERVDLNLLRPGEAHPTFDERVGLPAGKHTFEVICDPDDDVDEMDEGNNTYSRIYRILSHKCKIRGSKWNDLDGDGEWDQPGEPALADWKIYLDVNRNDRWDTGEPFDLTDAEGNYEFTDLWPARYIVAEEPQDGWTQTYPSYPGGPAPAPTAQQPLPEQPVAAQDGGEFVPDVLRRPSYEPFAPPFLQQPQVPPQLQFDPKTLPTWFDLRKGQYVTWVKDQGDCGSCWSFATYASLESSILMEGGRRRDLSENNLIHHHGFDWGPCYGGNFDMSQAYLSRWDGPVDEFYDPYSDDPNAPSPGGPLEYYVRESLEFDTTEEIKHAVMNYGALHTNMYWDPVCYRSGNYTYYYHGGTDANHAVAIVGWDDGKETREDLDPGAWLIKNSWGYGWGSSGYFWIAYQDTAACKYGVSFRDAVDPDSFNRIYYHDEFGHINSFNAPYALNAFTAARDEYVKAVQLWTLADGANYDLRIYDTFSEEAGLSDLLGSTTGTFAYAGYHTVDLPSVVPLTAGDGFYVYLHITNGGDYPQAMDERDWNWNRGCTAAAGESYYSPNGTNWSDLYDFQGGRFTSNFCIKALTVPEIPGTHTMVLDVGQHTTDVNFGNKVANNPPVLAPIGDQVLGEGSLLGFTATATDPDVPADTLEFSLGPGFPTGASIDPVTGVFTWTPTEAQGPGYYRVMVRVTDDGIPAMSDSETILVRVNESNQAPLLAPIGSQAVDEGTLLTFTATATDPDLPANELTFSLDTGFPAGASIEPTTGVFTWTPTEAQGPGSHEITVRVSDGSPFLTDSETITITVNEVNQAPSLSAIGSQAVDEGTLLTFTATATDPDLPANELTFSLDAGFPEGASIDPTTGVFTWTPTEAQGPDSYAVTVRVTDDGTPAMDDFETITITVIEVSEIVDRHVFYNNSSFDGNDPAADERDDDAVAIDKAALLPGGTATFENYTSYSRGINGIMIDVENLPDGITLDKHDFQFKVGNGDHPANWATAPDPTSVTLRPRQGVGDLHRATIIWDDNLIQKQWLQVTIPAGGDIGLLEADVFYFGNAVGESGNSTTDAKVNAYDMLGARDNQRTFVNPATIDFNYDYNRDRRVNAYDMLIARDNQTHFLNALKLITVPVGKAAEVSGWGAATLPEKNTSSSAARSGAGGNLDWLCEFQPVRSQRRPSREDNLKAKAVDKLLATAYATAEPRCR